MIMELIYRVGLNPIDMKLYSLITNFMADFITSSHMQIEKLSSSQR